ncbi:hypothetical protein [Streptomyces sp. NPDC002851]
MRRRTPHIAVVLATIALLTACTQKAASETSSKPSRKACTSDPCKAFDAGAKRGDKMLEDSEEITLTPEEMASLPDAPIDGDSSDDAMRAAMSHDAAVAEIACKREAGYAATEAEYGSDPEEAFMDDPKAERAFAEGCAAATSYNGVGLDHAREKYED